MVPEKETLPVAEEESFFEITWAALFWFVLAFPYILGWWFLGWRWMLETLRGEE